MYVLVYFGVLHDDEPVQLAYENRIIPLPDLWEQSDTNAYADTDANSNSDANTNSDTNTDADASTFCAKSAEQSQWRGTNNQPRPLDVDRQLK